MCSAPAIIAGSIPPAPMSTPTLELALEIFDSADSQWLGMNFRDDQFWKGVLLGAAVTLIFTSEAVQKTLIKGTAWSGRGEGEVRGHQGRAETEVRKKEIVIPC
jgi:hypothetical protein